MPYNDFYCGRMAPVYTEADQQMQQMQQMQMMQMMQGQQMPIMPYPIPYQMPYQPTMVVQQQLPTMPYQLPASGQQMAQSQRQFRQSIAQYCSYLQSQGATPAQINAVKAQLSYQPSAGYSSAMEELRRQVIINQANGIPNELGIYVTARGELKIPPASAPTIMQFIYYNLIQAKLLASTVAIEQVKFVRLSESMANQDLLRHACKFDLLNIIDLRVNRLQYFDKAIIEFAYCPNCLKIIYFFEKIG